MQIGRIEKTEPRFTPRRRAFRNGYNTGAAFSRIILKWLGIIESDDSFRYLGNELQRGRDRFSCQIRYDSEPLEERWTVQSKSCSCQALRQLSRSKSVGAKISDCGSMRPAAFIRSRFHDCVAA